MFPAPVGRLVLNLLLLAADLLPQGGVLRLDGGAGDLIARLHGPQAAWPAGLIGMLADAATAWQALGNPRTLQAPLTALLARHHGLRLRSWPPKLAPRRPIRAAGAPPLRRTVPPDRRSPLPGVSAPAIYLFFATFGAGSPGSHTRTPRGCSWTTCWPIS